MTNETGWNASAIADEAMHSLNHAATSQNDDNAHVFHAADPIVRALVAQALATLSLAEEQTTANLISYLELAERGRRAGYAPEVRDLDAKIRARLGLTDTEATR